MSLGVKMTDKLEARPDTARACCAGIVPRRTHCDTADLHKPQLFATLDGPPRSFSNFEISSIHKTFCKCFKIHPKFTKCNKKIQVILGSCCQFQMILDRNYHGVYSWDFLVTKRTAVWRGFISFLKDFLFNFKCHSNRCYPWTLYFSTAVLEKNNLYNCLKSFLAKWLRLEQKWERRLIYGEQQPYL